MVSLFKSGDQLFDEGIDLIKRKEYNKARSTFDKAIEKGSSKSALASLMISVIFILNNQSNANGYETLANDIDSANIPAFEFGLTNLECSKLSVECRLTAKKINLLAAGGNATLREKKGNDLIKLAQEYQRELGRDSLQLNELIYGDSTKTGADEACGLMALGYENLASAEVLSDPKKAAEILQNAANYRKQIGDDNSHDLELVRSYSKSAKCWICGRTTTGETIHFVSMSSEITPLMRTAQDSLLKSAPENFESIYVCRPCYSAISRRSDAIANKYYQDAIRELRTTEARLMAEIAEVRAYATMMRSR